MTAHTKKNKTCFNLPEELYPTNILTAWMLQDTINGIGDLLGDMVGAITS